jgi:ribulose bisphosphate carboxylase small subunit
MNTDYIVSLTYDQFKNNYLDYLDEIIRLEKFDSNELRLVMKCIVDKVVNQKINDEKKSEK